MHKKLIARTAKLLSEPKRGRQFKGIAITYEHIPQDLDERNHGSIYAIVNINTTTQEAEEVAELIIDTFHGEFYHDLSISPLAAFESSLSKINEELADITRQGKIGWLNNLNAILVVLSHNVLHITQAGKTEAFLYRGEKSSNISDDLAGDAVNPLRTFVNVASGELQEGDKIAIVTPSIFYHISKEELKKYVKEFQPKVSISHLADLLEGTSTTMNPNAILLLEAMTPEAASNETIDEQPDEIWISETSKPVETAIEASAPFVKKVLVFLIKAKEVSLIYYSEKIAPFAVSLFEKAKATAARKSSPEKARVLFDTNESIQYDEEPATLVMETVPEKISLKKKNEIFIKENQVKPKWLKLEKVDFSAARRIGKNLTNIAGKYTKNKKNTAIIAFFAVLLLSGSIFMVWRQRENAENLKLANASYTEAESKVSIARNALSSGNRSQAAVNLNDAKKIAEGLKDNKNKEIKEKANNLLADITKSLDEVENVIKPSVEEVANTGEISGNDVIGPIYVNRNIYLINKENGTISQISTSNNEASNVLDKPEIDGKVVAASAVSSRRIIVFVTDKGKFYEFDPAETKLSKQNVAGEIEKVVAMNSFSTNIYTVTSEGKVYKRTKNSDGYSSRTEYIKDNNYLSSAKSLAIDSNIYVLNKEGSIYKYLSGSKQNFAIYDLPSSISASSSIYTDENTESIFVVNESNNRILRFDKKGKYVSQFEIGAEKINGIYVDETNVYVSSSGKLLKFTY